MSDFFTRLAERTLGLLPTVKPLIAPMFARGLMWGRNRAFDALFRRRSVTNSVEKQRESKALTEHSALRLPPLVTSGQGVSAELRSGLVANVLQVNHSFAGEIPAAQMVPEFPHQASLTRALSISKSGEPPSLSGTMQPQPQLFDSTIQHSLDQTIEREELDFSELQSVKNPPSVSNLPAFPRGLSETNSTDLEMLSSHPTVRSQRNQPQIDALFSIEEQSTDASHYPSIAHPTEQSNQAHAQSPASDNTITDGAEFQHRFPSQPPNVGKLPTLQSSSESEDLGNFQEYGHSTIHPTIQPCSIEHSPLTHSQSAAMHQSIEQCNQAYSQSQNHIQAAQPQPLPSTVVSPSNPLEFSSSSTLPLVRSQASQAGVPKFSQSSTTESWDKSLRNYTSVSSPKSPVPNELEELKTRAILDTSLTSSSAAPSIEVGANSEFALPTQTLDSEDSIRENALTPILPTSITSTLPISTTEQQFNGARSSETARLTNSRFYFRSSLTSSAAPVAVKPRLEPTESSVIGADFSRALSLSSGDRRSRISPSLATEPAPTIQVTVGRLEVRGVTPSPSARSQEPPTRQESRLSLEDYLKQREEGHR